nr:hypothetical protein [uncultured Actinoplanes sp.]
MTTLDVRSQQTWHRPLLTLTAATIVLAVVAALGILLDPRIVTGVPAWLKPFKFAVSFAIYAFTLAWLLSVLPRRSRAGERAGTVIVAIAVIELVIIVLQAARGRMSHFNDATPFDETLWQAMGASVMVLFAAHVVIGVVALRQRIGDRATTYAIRLGLGLSLLGMLAAVPMVTPIQDPGIDGITGAHSVGVPDGGPGLPLTGWSTTGGDLRIGHFIGLHGLQALPLLAFLLSRYGRGLDVTTRARLVLIAGVAYGVLVALVTWQALRAQPLLRPDLLTLTALAALVAGTAIATVSVLGRRSA